MMVDRNEKVRGNLATFLNNALSTGTFGINAYTDALAEKAVNSLPAAEGLKSSSPGGLLDVVTSFPRWGTQPGVNPTLREIGNRQYQERVADSATYPTAAALGEIAGIAGSLPLGEGLGRGVVKGVKAGGNKLVKMLGDTAQKGKVGAKAGMGDLVPELKQVYAKAREVSKNTGIPFEELRKVAMANFMKQKGLVEGAPMTGLVKDVYANAKKWRNSINLGKAADIGGKGLQKVSDLASKATSYSPFANNVVKGALGGVGTNELRQISGQETGLDNTSSAILGGLGGGAAGIVGGIGKAVGGGGGLSRFAEKAIDYADNPYAYGGALNYLVGGKDNNPAPQPAPQVQAPVEQQNDLVSQTSPYDTSSAYEMSPIQKKYQDLYGN